MATTIADGARPQVNDRTALFSTTDYHRSNAVVPRMYHVAPDGRFLMLRQLPADSADAEARPPQINVVLNWFEDLTERVPN